MSSDYYGAIAGELADEGAGTERAFLEWLNEYTRHVAAGTYHDHLHAAFDAGRQSVRVGGDKPSVPGGFVLSNAYRSGQAGRRDADLARRALGVLGDRYSRRARQVAEARIADPEASWSEIGGKLGMTKEQATGLFKRLVTRAFRELGEAGPFSI